MNRTMSNLIAIVVGVVVLLLGVITCGPAKTQEPNLLKKAYAPEFTWGCPWFYPDCQMLTTPAKTLSLEVLPSAGNIGGAITMDPQ